MDVQPVRDLIEPLVTTTPEGAPEYVFTAGRTLAGQGNVTIASAETTRGKPRLGRIDRGKREKTIRPPK